MGQYDRVVGDAWMRRRRWTHKLLMREGLDDISSDKVEQLGTDGRPIKMRCGQ